METDTNIDESDELLSERQKSAGDEEENDDEESIFSLGVYPTAFRVGASVERAAQSMSLTPMAVAPSGIGGPVEAIPNL